MSSPTTITGLFATRLREARKVRDWTQAQLADAMVEVGHSIERSAISRIEKGQRQVTVEELVAFAAALDVPPVGLFLPPENDAEVALAPKVVVPVSKAWEWACGAGPLRRENARSYRHQSPELLGMLPVRPFPSVEETLALESGLPVNIVSQALALAERQQKEARRAD